MKRKVFWCAGLAVVLACASALRELLPRGYLVVDLSGGPDAVSYPVSRLRSAPEAGWPDEFKTTKMALRWIPAGTFMMGSPPNELGRYAKNETLRRVILTRGFYIGVFEVTQRQWERVMGNWPSEYKNPECRDARPVDQVTYGEVRGTGVGTNWPSSGAVDPDSFMGRLRAKTGRKIDLPTEAQWEYACRAGTVTALNSGHDLSDGKSDRHMDEVGRYYHNGGSAGQYNGIANYNGDTGTGTAKAGSYRPNAWGLYDMHGNGFEWCLDWYSDEPRGVFNPKGAQRGDCRMDRGGGWCHIAWGCRSASRAGTYPFYRGSFMGFRCALP